jgi:fructokinase
MFDVTALGEVLIDFTQTGVSDRGNPCFERNPGGAPANVLACLSRLGLKTAFIGKVGDDSFGGYLYDLLRGMNIDVRGLRIDPGAKTTLAFVQIHSTGERSFTFYRNPGADMLLRSDELDLSVVDECSVFHAGSLSLTDEPARSASIKALEYAKKTGRTISFDPNYRPMLWKNPSEAKEAILSAVPYADILKLSDEELLFLTGKTDCIEGTDWILEKFQTPLIFVTLGSKGAFFRFGRESGNVSAYSALHAVDTTGAGDTFLGGFLYSMLSRGIRHPREMTVESCSEMVRFACAAAGLCTTKFGAIPAMPTLGEIESVLETTFSAE